MASFVARTASKNNALWVHNNSLTEMITNINISLIQLKHMNLAMLYLFLKKQNNSTFKDMVFKMRVLVHVTI